jgi:glycosyltransferase involved in cell wall biosynthesis
VLDLVLTVVTVTFNAREAFLRTLSSVQGQTRRPQIEYLVIDGASSDGTVDEIQAAAGRGEVDSWVSEPDRGIYDAMNKAAAWSRGDYVLFLNAGDLFPTPDTVERFLTLEGRRPGFIWGDSEVDRGGRILPDPAGRMLRFLYRQMTVCHQSLAVRRDLLASHPFDLSLKVAADYAVLCALVTEAIEGEFRPVTVSRVQDEGFSSKNFFLGLEEKRRVSRTFFPRERWRSEPYFALWGLYMKLKIWYKERP